MKPPHSQEVTELSYPAGPQDPYGQQNFYGQGTAYSQPSGIDAPLRGASIGQSVNRFFKKYATGRAGPAAASSGGGT